MRKPVHRGGAGDTWTRISAAARALDAGGDTWG
jgi:hypothetical protein